MSPSIAQLPEQTEKPSIIVPLKAIPASAGNSQIRRVIDEEGETTTASVSIPLIFGILIYQVLYSVISTWFLRVTIRSIIKLYIESYC